MDSVEIETAAQGLVQDGRSFMDNFAASVRGGVGFANHIQHTVSGMRKHDLSGERSDIICAQLDDIKYNTGRKLFWWTSTIITICLGLFLLAQLVQLGTYLSTLIQYQEAFRKMWDEDKESRRQQLYELRRQNTLQEEIRSRVATARRGGRPDISPAPRPPPLHDPEVNAALDAAPPPGPQRDEWVHRVAQIAQRLRQAQEQHAQQEE
ncbi:hypothetical protein K449DRAFT_445978 [Hypoxylon sp. EC38]|nr:hypothetical protein K449DRAFT_445978 [Hypoxylon sp. EC38]